MILFLNQVPIDPGPEIMSIIAQFLTKHDLALCACVSQAWNQTCLPFLWQKIILAESVFEFSKVTTIDRLFPTPFPPRQDAEQQPQPHTFGQFSL